MMLQIFITKNLREEPTDKTTTALMEWQTRAPVAVNSLMEFWWDWAIEDCEPAIRRAIDEKTPPDIDKAQKKADLCVQRFTYVHWNEIKESIRLKAANFPVDNK